MCDLVLSDNKTRSTYHAKSCLHLPLNYGQRVKHSTFSKFFHYTHNLLTSIQGMGDSAKTETRPEAKVRYGSAFHF